MPIRGAWFYADLKLNVWGDAWTTVIMLVLGCAWILLDQRELPASVPSSQSPVPLSQRLFALLSLTFSLSGLLLIAWAAFRAGTTDAIRTPWPLMPEWTLPFVGVLWILALATAWRIRSTVIAAMQTACAIGATLSLAPLLYRIGYGFDGFLHVAGEKVLLSTGALLPKPPYYMGQYVFVTWLARLSDIDVSLIDRWLVPVLAAILIPAALALVVGRGRPATLIALILMPLGAFVATTPHGFATILGIIALILCMVIDNPDIKPATDGLPRACRGDGHPIGMANRFSTNPALPLLFALWSALTHPLIGLPILFATLMALAHASSERRKTLRIVSWFLAVSAGLVVPVVFGLASGLVRGRRDVGSEQPGNWDAFAATARFHSWVGNWYAIWPEASV